MALFDFLRRDQGPRDFSFLGVDMHSHVLPGIDDGAPDVATAVKLVVELGEMGYRQLVATPHVMGELHPNTPATIQGALGQLRTALAAAGITMPVSAAAEYMLDDNFARLLAEKAELLTFAGRRLLVELPQAGEPPGWQQTVFDLQTRGYRVVLAHPERYRYLAGNKAVFERLVDSGVELQLNLLSLTGYYGKGPKRSGEELLQQRWISLLGTDLHHERHVEALRKLQRKGRLLTTLERIGERQRQLHDNEH